VFAGIEPDERRLRAALNLRPTGVCSA